VKTIAVVIPVWNGAALIETCLASLLPQLQPGDEIIVADNGSSDGTPELVERDFSQAQVLRLERNWGYGGGANRGLTRAQADAVLILNHDITFNADCLAMLRRRLELNGPAVIGCKLLYPDGHTVQHAGGIIRMPRGEPDHYGYHQIDDGSWDQMMEPDYVTGALFVIDRSVLNAIGKFDEEFFPLYYEEVDYCYRAREAGFPVIYEPAAVAIHHESQTYGQRSATYHQAMSRGRLRFLLKHQSTVQFCDEFFPAERRWLADQPAGAYRRILVHAYLHAMLAVPRLQTQRLLADPETASAERLLDALEQLGHYALRPA
jgi:GT2 family glycosyltransferase